MSKLLSNRKKEWKLPIARLIELKIRQILNKHAPLWLRKIIIDYNIRTIKPFNDMDKMHKAGGGKVSYGRLHGDLDMWAFPRYEACKEKFEPVPGSVLKEMRLKPEYQKISDEYWKEYDANKKEQQKLYSDMEIFIKNTFPDIQSNEIVWNYDKDVIKRNGYVSINVNKYWHRLNKQEND